MPHRMFNADFMYTNVLYTSFIVVREEEYDIYLKIYIFLIILVVIISCIIAINVVLNEFCLFVPIKLSDLVIASE